MANTGGGYIIFGVKDRQAGGSPADRIVGIPRAGDHRKQLGDKLQGIQQQRQFETTPALVLPSPDAASAVLVAKIPRRQLRPHQVRQTGVFYRRGDGAQAIPMDFWEVQRQMVFQEERQRKMRPFRLKLTFTERIADELARVDPALSFGRFETGSIGALLADVLSLLPPDDALLYNLTEVLQEETGINEALDQLRGQILTHGIPLARTGLSLAQIINHRASTLGERCRECKRKRDSIFGALPL